MLTEWRLFTEEPPTSSPLAPDPELPDPILSKYPTDALVARFSEASVGSTVPF